MLLALLPCSTEKTLFSKLIREHSRKQGVHHQAMVSYVHEAERRVARESVYQSACTAAPPYEDASKGAVLLLCVASAMSDYIYSSPNPSPIRPPLHAQPSRRQKFSLLRFNISIQPTCVIMRRGGAIYTRGIRPQGKEPVGVEEEEADLHPAPPAPGRLGSGEPMAEI